MYGKAITSIKIVPEALSTLAKKNVFILGGTSGIGRALAHICAKNGASVIVAGRSFKDIGVSNIAFQKLDVSSLKDVAAYAKTMTPIPDIVFLTCGIVPNTTREVTNEGIEKDMAISTLSRLVLLRELLPRLTSGARVCVWGMPGNGHGAAGASHLDDLNAEKGYVGGFGWVHMNTVAVNEAIVYHFASLFKEKGISIYGMNPGLIVTDIRNPLHGGGCVGSIIEGLVGLFTPTVNQYAEKIIPVILGAKETGLSFGQSGCVIERESIFKQEDKVEEVYAAAEKLVKDKVCIQ